MSQHAEREHLERRPVGRDRLLSMNVAVVYRICVVSWRLRLELWEGEIVSVYPLCLTAETKRWLGCSQCHAADGTQPEEMRAGRESP